jgi:S1-C subfamily serine protease
LGSDSTNALALLAVPDLNLPPLHLEPAAQQRQGDPLLVLGYPMRT